MVDVARLQEYSLFGGLLPDDIDRIKPFLCGASYDAGEAILKEGEPNGRLHFVIEGRVEVTKRDKRIVELGEGDAFGEVELLDVLPAVATIRSLTPTKIVYLSNHNLHDIYKTDPRIFAMLIMNLARELARRLRWMDELACAARNEGGGNDQDGS
ncbi:MAG: cyclic nucleotide-binding domain-containing protein [Spirochaetales bacterium]|nr:MAG: cyclic nucleotide-binding domain-containing protein [Spirochaetales bacterium]